MTWWNRGARLTKRALAGVPASTWLLVDLAILMASVGLGFRLFPPAPSGELPHVVYWQAAAVFTFSVIVSSLVFGLYERETVMDRSRVAARMLLTTGTAALLVYAIIHVLMYSVVSRRITGASLATFFVAGSLARLAAWWAVHNVERGLLVVGTRGLFESFQQAQREGFLREYRLMGYVSTRPSAAPETDPHLLGELPDLLRVLRRDRVSDIVVGATAATDANIMEGMVAAMSDGCRVTNEATFYEKATGQILVDEITPDWFLFADLKIHCDQHATLKRLTDLMIAGLGLCLTAPVWPLIALAIKLGDRGPVFYSQDRVGQNGRAFRLYKFRTMRPDAENGRSVWACPADPRVTRIGRILRRTRLDELPQLWNVLTGHMSIVGPRPERPDIVADLCREVPYYNERHLLKPGITGWAQISFRYGASVADAKRKLQFDLFYLKHMSFELDMVILFRTLGTFLRGAC
jgi:sugar transferase (PEP-CTERM system associated)